MRGSGSSPRRSAGTSGRRSHDRAPRQWRRIPLPPTGAPCRRQRAPASLPETIPPVPPPLDPGHGPIPVPDQQGVPQEQAVPCRQEQTGGHRSHLVHVAVREDRLVHPRPGRPVVPGPEAFMRGKPPLLPHLAVAAHGIGDQPGVAPAGHLPPSQLGQADPGFVVDPGAVAHRAHVVGHRVEPQECGVSRQREKVSVPMAP